LLRGLALVLLLAPAAAGFVRAESPRAAELVYASVRSIDEQTGPRVDQVADLFVLRVDGTGLRRLTRTVDWEDAPAWSHDGKQLAYARGSPTCHANACEGAFRASIWVAGSDGSRPRRLTDGVARGLLDGSPSWSPDARLLAFTRRYCCDASPQDGIYVVGSNGTGLRRLVSMRAQAVAWSPDGRRLAFAGELATGLRLVEPESGDVTKLEAAGLPSSISDVAWAPDGKRLAAATRQGLFIVPSAGGRARRVGAARPVRDVVWSPNGGRLAFTAPRTARGRRTDLYVVDTDGRGLKRLTANPGYDLAPSWR